MNDSEGLQNHRTAAEPAMADVTVAEATFQGGELHVLVPGPPVRLAAEAYFNTHADSYGLRRRDGL